MNYQCLIVDLEKDGIQQTVQELTEAPLGLTLSYATNDDVEPMLQTGGVIAIVVVCAAPCNEVFKILEAFKHASGVIPHFQAIVCDEPSPIFMTQVYEYGVENFFGRNRFAQSIQSFCAKVCELLNDENSSEAKCISLSQAMQRGDQAKLHESLHALDDMAKHDFLAAHSRGMALQALGKYSDAIAAFEHSKKLNKMFRPSVTGIGENLLVLGKTDEALSVFEQLEKLNKRSMDRKVNLAMVYIERKDLNSAKRYMLEAEALDPTNNRLEEIRTQLLLAQGKLKEAFDKMDNLHDVGPFFAAKLNEMGIKLSQAGKGKSALALYQKAHKIVRIELKYKISLNAALACYRLNDFTRALKYLQRSEKEYGEPLEKAVKIKKAIAAQQRKKTATQKVG